MCGTYCRSGGSEALRSAAEQGDWYSAIEVRACGLDTGWFIERAELAKNRVGPIEQRARRRDVAGALAQGGARDHGPREIVAGADALQNAHRGLDIGLGRRRRFGREAFADQPARQTLELRVAH